MVPPPAREKKMLGGEPGPWENPSIEREPTGESGTAIRLAVGRKNRPEVLRLGREGQKNREG